MLPAYCTITCLNTCKEPAALVIIRCLCLLYAKTCLINMIKLVQSISTTYPADLLFCALSASLFIQV